MLDQINLLVVDDTTFMRKKIVRFLIDNGFNEASIQEAENGSDALALLAQGADYDLIISDLNMPRTNGLEFLRKIRGSSNERIKNFKFILLTTDSEKEKIIEAVKLKANGYVLKSLLETKLLPEIKRVLEIQRK